MPVLRLNSSVWLPNHAIKLGNDYLYCAVGAQPRRVKITGYSRAVNATKYLCHALNADGTISTGANAKTEWVSPQFRALNDMPIDWRQYTSIKLELQMSE